MKPLIEISPGVFCPHTLEELAKAQERWAAYYDAATARGEIIGAGGPREPDTMGLSVGRGWAS